jgi:DnaK suppressor protein
MKQIMKQLEKEKLKKNIQKEIDLLHEEIRNIEKQLSPIKKDCSLDNIAHASLKQDQNINIQRYEVAKKRLNSLKATLLRIDTKEYGICKECEEEINPARLELLPESQYCVRCMEELGL